MSAVVHLGYDAIAFWRSQFGHTVPAVPEQTEEIIAAYVQLAQKVSDVSLRQQDAGIALPDLIIESLRSEFDEFGNAMGSEILRCFGMDATRALIRRGRCERAKIAIRHHNSDDGVLMEHELSIGPHTAEFYGDVPTRVHIPSTGEGIRSLHYDLDNIRFNLRDVGPVSEDMRSQEWNMAYLAATSSLIDLMLHQMFGDFDLRAFYLPADRTGVMHAHSAVVSAVVDNAPMAGLQPVRQTPLLSGVLSDFLSQLIPNQPISKLGVNTITQYTGRVGVSQ